VVDLAVGVIIGAAFGSVVKSAVDDLMMPPLGYLMGGVDFGDKTLKISVPPLPGTTIAAKEIEIRYGKFLNVLLALVIQGVSIFVVIKVMNKLRKPAPAPAAGPPPLTKDQELLVEIRDLLKRSPK
jgi:large conductance mechanosensitive channel